MKKKKKRQRSKTPSRKGNNDDEEVIDFFPELKGAALIRELHVYGQLMPALQGVSMSKKGTNQHTGFGTRLMNKAEEIAREHHKVSKVAVIAGVGVRNYYRKLGYHQKGESEMLVKELPLDSIKLKLFGLLLFALTLIFASTFLQPI